MKDRVMAHRSDDVIERARVREVAGIFYSRARVNEAVDELLRAGFDRADIDIIGNLEDVRAKLGNVYVAAQELPDVPDVPRRPFFAREDISLAVAVIAGSVGAACAMGAAFAIVASGVESTYAGAIAATVGALVGTFGSLLVAQFIKGKHRPDIDPMLEAHGIVLWVRVHTPEQEAKAQRILVQHGGDAVRIHEIEVGKRLEDIPLSTLRPDPWLGDERLGQP
jgi:hypothetical protein